MDAEVRLSSLIQSASIIDDSFAEKILSDLDTSRLPSSIIQSTEIKHQIDRVKSNPSKQKDIRGSKREREKILSEAYRAWLSSLVVNRLTIQETDTLLDQLKESLNYDSNLVYQVTEWCIENIQRGSLREGLDPLAFIQLVDIVDKISCFATENNDEIKGMLGNTTPIVSDKITSFGVGETKKARQFIFNWIRENTKDSIIFCDPYFGLSELIFLRYVPIEHPITIITTERGISLLGDKEEMKRNIIEAWRKDTDQEFPDITIYIYPTSSEEKFHDRAIISSVNAISMGQSLNGLGKARGIVNLLSNDETRELEENYINPLMLTTKLRKEHRPKIIEV